MKQTLQRLLDTVDEETDELVGLHQELVRIPTVNTGAPDSGNETEVCRSLEQRLGAEGIPSLTLESAPSRGNLVAHIGEQSGPRLLLMSHTDVVPVDESRWKLPPFCGEVVDGKVYGRGSDDCKSLVASGAMALILLKRAGIPLRGELRLLAAADEESGGRYGIAWLAENHPDEIRADWAINEGGGRPLRTNDGLVYLVSVAEKGRLEARFQVEGRSGHAALPWAADNATYKLAQLLDRIQSYQPEIDLSMATFEHLPLLGVEEKADPGRFEVLLDALGRREPSLAGTLMALSRMTVAPTMVTSGIKSNSIPALAELTCDVRTLPHQDESYVRSQLDGLLKGIEGSHLKLETWAVSNASPFDAPFVTQLKRATELALDREDVTLVPSACAGFTDSRCVRPLGAQVYGFAPLTPGSDTVRPGVHGVDEAMEIDNLVLRTKMQVALAYLTLCGQSI
jgi:acetylornithine deacetylase/succinyl-diaminopimelate desuccinylase-like protein